MVELVDYVNITGKITLIETDMTERGATVSFDGKNDPSRITK